LANDDSPAKVDAAIAFHPSFLVEADLKNITNVPCAIFKGDQDDMLSEDQLDQVRFLFFSLLLLQSLLAERVASADLIVRE
jgi:predicted esterase